MKKYKDLDELDKLIKVLDYEQAKQGLDNNEDVFDDYQKYVTFASQIAVFLDKGSFTQSICFENLPKDKEEFIKINKKMGFNIHLSLINCIDVLIERYGLDGADGMGILNQGMKLGTIMYKLNHLTNEEYQELQEYNLKLSKKTNTKKR